ncbi:uncharacterized protein MELLADRAFT_71135 [Melampsora larici-populina 98AG31]|uniref:Uncharacterized protein n=1 Tax=Melampsora larici-populina (strain 98AG31 / pathotype 3-4-7) TaxID=747676 RepID=F4RCL3_MELLP|nr:uncharacterized protein MELLADRAFT_71135 [Melampsora larici-populina 98AG31]EGG09752.1 hypothetical protein MELLADRAFT_71135 [Melampsora larici-populina 98AG31]
MPPFVFRGFENGKRERSLSQLESQLHILSSTHNLCSTPQHSSSTSRTEKDDAKDRPEFLIAQTTAEMKGIEFFAYKGSTLAKRRLELCPSDESITSYDTYGKPVKSVDTSTSLTPNGSPSKSVSRSKLMAMNRAMRLRMIEAIKRRIRSTLSSAFSGGSRKRQKLGIEDDEWLDVTAIIEEHTQSTKGYRQLNEFGRLQPATGPCAKPYVTNDTYHLDQIIQSDLMWHFESYRPN